MMEPESAFVALFNLRCQEAHDWQIAKGFVKRGEPRDELKVLCLIHGEVSEAAEAVRHGNPPDSHIPAFSGVEAELADVVIRCMGYAAERGYRLGDVIVEKMRYNWTRPHMNGGKLS